MNYDRQGTSLNRVEGSVRFTIDRCIQFQIENFDKIWEKLTAFDTLCVLMKKIYCEKLIIWEKWSVIWSLRNVEEKKKKFFYWVAYITNKF